jgi:hypothetical protein
MKIYGFYFAALMNNWKSIVEPQLEYLLNSELYIKTDILHVRIFYENYNDLEYLTKKLKEYKKVNITSTKINEFEFGILDTIKKLSSTDDFYCYYLHSKGVSINEKNKSFYKNANDLKYLLKCVESWRNYMEYFIIENFELCINSLKNDWDACGVNLSEHPSIHYSGNFWWSKSSHLRKLPDINSINLKNRWDAEKWIGMAKGKLKSLYSTSQAGYRQIISENYKTH